MRKNIDNPEDELIFEISNNRISYEDFRSKYFHDESSRYRLAYNNLYDHGLVTEDNNIMRLTKTGKEVYLYKDFKKHVSQSKIGMRDLNESKAKTGNHWSKYIPHIAVIIVILAILVTLTLYI